LRATSGHRDSHAATLSLKDGPKATLSTGVSRATILDPNGGPKATPRAQGVAFWPLIRLRGGFQATLKSTRGGTQPPPTLGVDASHHQRWHRPPLGVARRSPHFFIFFIFIFIFIFSFIYLLLISASSNFYQLKENAAQNSRVNFMISSPKNLNRIQNNI
jgi:hypothetical protein